MLVPRSLQQRCSLPGWKGSRTNSWLKYAVKRNINHPVSPLDHYCIFQKVFLAPVMSQFMFLHSNTSADLDKGSFYSWTDLKVLLPFMHELPEERKQTEQLFHCPGEVLPALRRSVHACSLHHTVTLHRGQEK